MKAIGDTTFRVKVAICLSVKDLRQKAKAVLGLAPKLTIRVIFGASFFNGQIDRIESKKQTSCPKSGHAVIIVASFDDIDAAQLSDGIMKRPVRTVQSNSAVLWVAKARTITPKIEISVVVQMKETKTYMIEATFRANDGNQLSVATGKAETLLHQTIYAMIANMLNEPMSLLRNTEIAALGRAPSKIVSERAERPPASHVNVVLIFNEKQRKERHFT